MDIKQGTRTSTRVSSVSVGVQAMQPLIGKKVFDFGIINSSFWPLIYQCANKVVT